MALCIITWNLPPKEQMVAYDNKPPVWVPSILKQPGAREFNSYRNLFPATPNVMVTIEFDSISSWARWVESKDFVTLVADIAAVGCTNVTWQIWNQSPTIHEPIKTESLSQWKYTPPRT